MDVLAHGRASRYARFFDVDWEGQEKSLQGRVLLPILGRPYGDALAAGESRHRTTISRCVRSGRSGGP
jgi:(1->4)-alpha-D-glucan 1-alpha-D-glucosylmutase